jgi:predicted molibdopterin-dependent oxidoreductase YjgC
MNQNNDNITVTIDNKAYHVKKGLTILQAAEQNDIYIPNLCAHKDLSPYGGCRICIVEVEGMSNFPTACTTPVQNNMLIRTHTSQIQAARREILQLFMSEHTSSCLVCDEKDECKLFSDTIHKAGVTTGCRHCPNDGSCELQDIVEYLKIDEINYPIYYRNLQLEKEDPFYDRDYNLCILCGRCIRMCQEVRLANVLAFKHKGREAIIGPAYQRTHIEAGCEFCGACVSVCPTGTLYEKARKWDGKPDQEQITTCTYCGVGCQMRLLIKNDRIIGSLPVDDPLVNRGQLCVKGRFCVTEMVNNYKRIQKPNKAFLDTKVEISWDEAIDIAAQKLSACSPDEFGMLISPNCTNEDLYLAQKFVRLAMESHNIDTSARLFYGNGFNAYLNLLRKAVPLENVRNTDAILCIGLDTRFGRSVVGVELRRALKEGAKIITINPYEHNLTLLAEKWIQPEPGTELNILHSLLELTHKKSSPDNSDADLNETAKILNSASRPVILVGSEFMQYQNSAQILTSIEKLADNLNAGILPLPAQNNLYGSILMGAYPELLPGGFSSKNSKKISEIKKKWKADIPEFSSQWNILNFTSKKKLKVLYLVGEFPPEVEKKPADFVISQNLYSPDSPLEPDLILPAAAFTEIDGTFINGEGRIQRVNKAVNPPGKTLPDWEILCRIARKMGVKGFDFNNVTEIHKEISAYYERFKDFDNPDRKSEALNCEANFTIPQLKSSEAQNSNNEYPFQLTTSIIEHSYRGIPLSTYVEGAQKIFDVDTLGINPQDAEKAKIKSADKVILTSPQFKKVFSAKIVPGLRPKILHVTLSSGINIGANPCSVKIRKKNV